MKGTLQYMVAKADGQLEEDAVRTRDMLQRAMLR